MLRNKSHRQLFGILLCVVAGLFYCYEYILRILPGALQTELMEAFGHISASQFGEISALYYLAYSPMQWPVGLLMDRYGPRCILTFACLCCAAGSWMFTQTHALWLVGAGRFLVGFGSSFAFVGVLFLGHHWLSRKYFSLLVGLVMTFAMFSVMYGLVKITDLAGHMGLTAIQHVLVILGIVLAALILLLVRDAPEGEVATRVQPIKLFLKEVWLVMICPSVWIIGLIGALLYTSLSVFGELWGKGYLETVHHLTKIDAAKVISAVFLGWAVGAPISGYFSDHTGQRIKPLWVCALLGLISISIVLYVPGLSFWTLSLLLFAYGIFTSAEILVFAMGKEVIDVRLSGTVFATVNMIVMLVGMLLQPLVGYLLDWSASEPAMGSNYVYSILDYQKALSVLPLSLLFVIALLSCYKFRKIQDD